MRCYNGCPDDQLAAIWDSRDKARAALKRADPKAWCTYFPIENMYSCARWLEDGSFQDLTPDFYTTVEGACEAAIKRIHELDGVL
jgi:hypothetical protein